MQPFEEKFFKKILRKLLLSAADWATRSMSRCPLFYNLPNIGEEVFLETVMIVREDAQLLYGFLTSQEKSVFRQLLKVSGIGPRISLAMLSSMSAEDIGNAIANNEIGLLTMVPGIGKKTAERLVLELKDKMVVTSRPRFLPFRQRSSRLWLRWVSANAKLAALRKTSLQMPTPPKAFVSVCVNLLRKVNPWRTAIRFFL